MISYKYFKKLEEAEFPFDQYDVDEHVVVVIFPDGKEITYPLERPPTLSHLIDECIRLNNDFHLEHLYKNWGATTCTDKSSRWFFANTAEDAVAQLYLHLKGLQ